MWGGVLCTVDPDSEKRYFYTFLSHFLYLLLITEFLFWIQQINEQKINNQKIDVKRGVLKKKKCENIISREFYNSAVPNFKL